MGFWNQSLGDYLDERKSAKTGEPIGKRYEATIFGTTKTGYLELKRDGRMAYIDTTPSKATRFHVDDIAKAGIEDGAELQRRSTVARAGGGAVVGGVLLGPVGLLAGLGLGAVAKKESGGEKFLVLDLEDGRTVFALVARKHVTQAHKLLHQIQPSG